MYEDLINLLRRCGKQKCKNCEYEHVLGCVTKMNEQAANAIEAMNYELKSLYKLLGTHPDPRGENGDMGVECMVLSETEKATQEQPSDSPSLGYYYAFLFDETTGKTYMPKEES